MPQNPGIGGLDELTLDEEVAIQQIASISGDDYIVGFDELDGFVGFVIGTGLTYDHSTHTLTASGSGSGPAFGTDNQIPYTNAAGDDFDYTTGFTFDGTDFAAPGDVSVGDDLLLTSSGSVINWNSGDITLTHSANTLTFAGMSSGLDLGASSSLKFGGVTVLQDLTGTTTLSEIDALDATTEATIEAAIDTLANLVSIQGRTVTLADAGADVIFGWDDSANAYENLTQAEVLAVIGNAAADGTTKGVAGFNATNFSASSGIINTIQNITTTSNPQFATIELGHATQNTLSASGGVLSIESVVIPTVSSTNTLTNKRITRRLTTTNAPGATPTTNTDNVDVMNFTGLATNITSMTTNLSGTPTDGQLVEFRFTDNSTPRTIAWGASFGATTIALPTTTVASTMLRVLFEWNGSIWQCIATA